MADHTVDIGLAHGLLANSLFHHPRHPSSPMSRIQAAIDKADASIRNVIQLLEAV